MKRRLQHDSDPGIDSLVRALETQAAVFERRHRTERDRRSAAELASAARLARRLAEEFATVARLDGIAPRARRPGRIRPPGGRDDGVSVPDAFLACLERMPLGPIRDRVLRAYLQMRRVLDDLEYRASRPAPVVLRSRPRGA